MEQTLFYSFFEVSVRRDADYEQEMDYYKKAFHDIYTSDFLMRNTFVVPVQFLYARLVANQRSSLPSSVFGTVREYISPCAHRNTIP
jgi:hypothetical protein